jgi:hypothetical protein
MDTDYSALASRVAAFSDVLGCIILSSDGLVLGSFPPADGDGDGIKAAWLRFAAIGNPERGFVKVDNQLWAYLSSGPYAAFAVAVGSTRPGVLIDHLEQTLAVAGESRDNLAVARPPGRVELVAGTKPKAVVAPQGSEEPVTSTNGSGEKAFEAPLAAHAAPPVEPVPVGHTPIFERIRTHMVEPFFEEPLSPELERAISERVGAEVDRPLAESDAPETELPVAEPGELDDLSEPLGSSFNEQLSEPLGSSFNAELLQPLGSSLNGELSDPLGSSFNAEPEPLDLFDEASDEAVEAVEAVGTSFDEALPEPLEPSVDEPVTEEDPGPEEAAPPEYSDDPDMSVPEFTDEAEIDPVALAREFAGLLQEDRPGDEDSA